VTAGHVITLLSRPGCHLCDDARAVIARVAAEAGVPWEERDITGSPQDLREYGEMIPVTLIDGVQHDFWRVDERRLRQVLGSLSGRTLPDARLTRPADFVQTFTRAYGVMQEHDAGGSGLRRPPCRSPQELPAYVPPNQVR